MSCTSNVAANFIKDCTHRPKQGIEEKWYANWSDIDFAATQMANGGNTVTTLVLNAGANIYTAAGNDKTSGIQHSFVTGDLVDGYTHTDTFTILLNSKENREQASNIGRVVTISKKIDGGLAGELRYEIAGLEAGMVRSADDYDSNANGGTRTITVSTREGQEENTGIKIFSDTDLATTEAWIAANVAP